MGQGLGGIDEANATLEQHLRRERERTGYVTDLMFLRYRTGLVRENTIFLNVTKLFNLNNVKLGLGDSIIIGRMTRQYSRSLAAPYFCRQLSPESRNHS